MRAKLINEKFTEETDPIEDMGIGIPEMRELRKNYEKLGDFINFDVEDLNFGDVILTLDKLKNIIFHTVVFYFNQKYNLNIEIREGYNVYNTFGVAKIPGYMFEFSKSNSGMSVDIKLWKKGGFDIDKTPQCKSIHRLEDAFLKMCKRNNIKLKTKET